MVVDLFDLYYQPPENLSSPLIRIQVTINADLPYKWQ
jgi:hypothetical protein